MARNAFLFLLAYLLVGCIPAIAQTGIITTIAGSGATGVSSGSFVMAGSGGPATAAVLGEPWGVAADGAGNIFYSDHFSNRIIKISSSGIITPYAGNGVAGYTGDGGQATAANINATFGLAADAYGNVYIAGSIGNNVIRKVTPAGIISTVAGTGTAGSSGDYGPATAARLNYAYGVAVDGSGNIYIADVGNNKVRKVSAAGIITTFAGNGVLGFAGDGGAANLAHLNNPYGVAANAAGNVYIADIGNHRIRKVTPAGIISTVAGTGSGVYSGDNGPATDAGLPDCWGVAVDGAGNIYIPDHSYHRIRVVNSAGYITSYVGDGTSGFFGDGGPSTSAKITEPIGVGVDAAGNVYIPDLHNARIRKVSGHDHPPVFLGGHALHITVCGNTLADSVNSLLKIHDSDLYQQERWSLISGPSHGAATIADTMLTMGDTLTPAGLCYSPSLGYSGADSFRVRVTDGLTSDTTTLYINVLPAPMPISGSTLLCTSVSSTLSNTVTGGVWSSSHPTVATVGSTGIVNPLTNGTSLISYTVASGCAATVVVTVSPLPPAITGALQVCRGETSALADSVSGGTWVTSNTAVAIIGSSTGVVTGVSAGTSPLTYTTPGGCIRTAVVTVNPIASIVPGIATICAGTSVTLTDSATGGIWSSPGYSSIAIVGSSSGVVTGVAAGSAAVTYTMPLTGCSATMTLSVGFSPSSIIGTPHACVGAGTSLFDGTTGGSWVSGNPSVATVGSSSGVVTGVTSGTVLISYLLPATGCAATLPVTVDVSPSVITGYPGICVSHSAPYSDSVSGGAWSSSSALVAYIDPSTGVASGITYGTSTLTYTLTGGCYRTKNITVNPIPAIITGGAPFCVGSSLPLSNSVPGGIWTSSATSTASVGSLSGSVFGVTGGSVTITYSMGPGCDATLPVTVSPLPMPIGGTARVCEAGTTLLTDATTGGAWSSGSLGTATIGSSSGLVTGVLAGITTISYTSSASPGCTITTLLTVNPLPSPITGTVLACPAQSDTLSDASPGGIWLSGNTAIASVASLSGVVTGVTGGTADISYLLPTGCSVSVVATVNPSPSAIAGSGLVCVSGTTALSDTLTGGTWSAPGYGSVLTIGSSSGIVSGTGGGVGVVTYTLPTGCTATRSLTVNTSPGSITGTLKVCQGSTTLLSDPATGGNWSSANTGIAAVGSVSGVVVGVASGIVNITYAVGTGCYAVAPVTVNPLPGMFTVSGGGGYCAGGSGVHVFLSGSGSGITYQLLLGGVPTGTSMPGTGTAIDMGAQTTAGVYTIVATNIATSCMRTMTGSATVAVNPLPATITGPGAVCIGAHVTEVDASIGGSWTSGSSSVATIGSSTGVVTGVALGSAVITYTLPTGCLATRTITVASTPSAIIGGPVVCMGTPALLTDGITGGVWSTTSGNISVGSLSGSVSGITVGPATVTYSLGSGCTTTAALTVSPAPSAITGAPGICPSASTALADATPGGTWTSLATGVATIGSASGMVSAVATGTTTIRYTVATGCSASLVFTVYPLPAAISGSARGCPGLPATLTDASTGGLWSAPGYGSILSVDSTSGIVTGVVAGTGVVTYTLPTGCSTTAGFTVNPLPAPVTGITETCIGSSTALHDVTPGGAWSSSMPSVCTVSSAGVVSGIAVGTATVSYTAAGCPSVVTVTVHPLPGAVLGAGHVCVGSSIILTDPPGGGTWSTATPAIAGVGSASGIVTGASGGVGVITYTHGAGCTSTASVTVDPLPSPISGSAGICLGGSATLTDVTPGGSWSVAGTSGVISIGSASGLVSGLLGGTAIVSYTIATGCAATLTVTVVIVPAITGLRNICAWGDTLYISDPNPTGTYSSSLVTVTNLGTGNARVTSFAPGAASIIYTLPGGCTLTVPLIVNPLPASITGATNLCAGSSAAFTDGTPGGVWSSGAPGIATVGSSSGLVTGAGAGVTRITYTIPTGCHVDTPVVVSIFPGAGIITGDTSVCIGASVTLFDTATGGTWGSSNANATVAAGMVTGIATGADTISYAVTNVCGTASAYRSVIVYPAVDAGAISGTDSVCMGNTVLLSDPASGGAWSCTGSNASISATGLLTGVAPGFDTVRYTVSNAGCSAVALKPVKVLSLAVCGSLGTYGATPGTEALHMFPNPSNGSFTLRLSSGVAGDIEIVVTNMLGTEVYRAAGRSNTARDIYLTTSGVYIITVTTTSGTQVGKIVVE